MVSLSGFAANGWHGLQTILDNSRSSYAQLLAASSLLKVVTEQSLRCVTASPHRIWNRPHAAAAAAAQAFHIHLQLVRSRGHSRGKQAPPTQLVQSAT